MDSDEPKFVSAQQHTHTRTRSARSFEFVRFIRLLFLCFSLSPVFFRQSAPAAASSKIDAQEEKVTESKIKSGWGRQLREDEVDEDG